MKATKIFFEGDLQIYNPSSEYNKDSARFKATEAYIDWVLNNPKLNNEDIIYFSLGDFFELSHPLPSENELGLSYLTQGKWKHKYILSGNHCYNRLRNDFSISIFNKLLNTTLIKKPQELDIEGLSTLCLPYYYDNIYSDLKPMKVEYENMQGEYDIIISHIQDETQAFISNDPNSINISKLKGERIQGHLHAVKNNVSGYVNSPLANTKGEVLDKRYCFLYDIETKIIEKVEIPNFLNYSELSYPEKLTNEKIGEFFTLFTIKDYTDKQTAIDFYRKDNPNLYIKEMIKKKLQSVSDEYKSQSKKSIKDFFEDYSSENKISKELSNIILEKIAIL